MNTTTNKEQTALTLPQRAAVALRTDEHEIKLRELLTNSARIVAPANKAGRDECHAAYMVLKNARCGITNLSDDATEDAKAFTKAVKAEAVRLIAIITAEEERLQGLRDDYDAKVEAEKQAKIAAERERLERIAGLIDAIKAVPATHVASDSATLRDVILTYSLVDISEAEFEEFRDKAILAMGITLDTLNTMLETAERREQEAAEAEAARIAEAQRIADERAELARLRAAHQAESDRVAAINAAEAKRLAVLAAQTEENMRAEREAQAELVRIEREKAAAVAAETKRQIEAQQAQIANDRAVLAAQQAAADARDAEALRVQQDAARREDDHGPALAMNAQFDAECKLAAAMKAPEIQRLPNHAEIDALIEDLADFPTDLDIVDIFIENFGGTESEAVARLAKFNAVSVLAELNETAEV